jgi:3-oxoacyl-(acyl-carrier-protein) synthase
MTSIALSKEIDQAPTFVAPLDSNSFAKIEALKQSDSKYKFLDNSVLYAMETSRKALEQAGWTSNDVFGINIGSSRGATALFENTTRNIWIQERHKL